MPYIKAERRGELLRVERDSANPGELNFIISAIIWQYWKERQRYQAINDIVGALEGAKLEFYRRVAIPYENAMMAENGDVYT